MPSRCSAITRDFPDNITAELNRFNRAGVPLVLVYPKDAAAPPIVLPEILTPGIVLERPGPRGALTDCIVAQASTPVNPNHRPESLCHSPPHGCVDILNGTATLVSLNLNN